ncbi:MAG: protein TonB [Roseivirga sp.]|jgi:protein TonB
MKKSLLMIAIVLFAFSCEEDDIYIEELDQVGKMIDVIPEGKRSTGDEIFIVVEEMPTFPGGTEAYKEFQLNNLTYPAEAAIAKVEGKVILSFVIDKEGTLSDIVVARGIGHGCDEAAVKMLIKSPSWTAGIQRGRAVKTKMNLAVIFKLI